MRKKLRGVWILLLLGLGFALPASVYAQRGGSSIPDAGIKAQLKELGYDYEVEDSNDFKIVVKVGDSKGRSQLVRIMSTAETYGEYSVREIWSASYVSPAADFPAPVANRLLQASDLSKLGGWVKHDRVGMFVMKIPSDASNQALDDAIHLAVKLADEMENELTPGKDDL
jgi:hypothetical protein